jgi:hypothetical protein
MVLDMDRPPIKTRKSSRTSRHSKGFDLSLWEESIRREYAEREKDRLATLSRIGTLLTEYFKNRVTLTAQWS